MRNRLRYLRVSLLNQCNLACSYCRPDGAGEDQRRRTRPGAFAESIRALHHFGVRKVRFTGGEPTLYRELPELIAATKSLSTDVYCAMTSNGVLLESTAGRLADAGLDSVNISLDTLRPDKFRQIAGVDALAEVLAGMRAAVTSLAQVKLNCVVMSGVNDDETSELVRFADREGVDIRFIEYMPTRHGLNRNRLYVPGDKIRLKLPYELRPVATNPASSARYYTAADLRIRVGFINPVSHSFCTHCDRIRLSSSGRLYGCLFSDRSFDLFAALRSGIGTTRAEVEHLLTAKQYLGCAPPDREADNLPSFVNIGG